MTSSMRAIDAGAFVDADRFLREVVEPCRPVVLRGLVANWPAVRAGAGPATGFRDYLARFDRAVPIEAFVGAPEIRGRYYYGPELAGFNFDRQRMTLQEALGAILRGMQEPQSPTIYAGSVSVDDALPGFPADNALPILPAVRPRIWLGHASTVSAHYDTLDNVACVVAGSRRFTLYPPELIAGLYVGPIDHTMAGQPISLAASAAPGDKGFPLFEAVREQALVAELAPGDALYLPKLWWHQVEATASFNVLVNYWWDAFAAGPDSPYTAMLLAMITLAERPGPEQNAWRALFDHYVFRRNGHPLAHLPPERHGILGPLRPGNYGRVRAYVMNMLRGG